MKLYEYEGKKLFSKYGIEIPGKNGKGPLVVKAQTLSGNRMKAGGILFAKNRAEAKKLARKLSGRVLIENKIEYTAEYYVSISYDTDTRGPVLAISPKGGSGISKATVTAIDFVVGVPQFFIREALQRAGFPAGDARGLVAVVEKLWSLFTQEYALLAEINPLFKTQEGRFIAGDSKIILDDEKIMPGTRRFIDMGGDIAILASGGGASMLNIDSLINVGGRPANYTEYSGNPPANVVRDLTKRVLKQKGLKGCWVIGGTANFTDIYETLKGFVEGLRAVKPKPKYPIVIRRDGPRQKEALAMLENITAKEGYDFHVFGSETAMAETAKIMVKLAYGNSRR